MGEHAKTDHGLETEWLPHAPVHMEAVLALHNSGLHSFGPASFGEMEATTNEDLFPFMERKFHSTQPRKQADKIPANLGPKAFKWKLREQSGPQLARIGGSSGR